MSPITALTNRLQHLLIGVNLPLLALSALLAAGPGWAGEVARAARLDQEAATAPLTIVVFTRADCRYCTLVKRDYLQALQDAPRYQRQVIVREVRQDTDWPLRDFTGAPTTHRRYASAQGITLVPVVAFFDRRGNALTEPILGARLGDFYQSYLDEAIRVSLAKQRENGQ